jgi:hypothetical protein
MDMLYLQKYISLKMVGDMYMSPVYEPMTNKTVFGLDDWIYSYLILQSFVITIICNAITDLPTSQITRTRCLLSFY